MTRMLLTRVWSPANCCQRSRISASLLARSPSPDDCSPTPEIDMPQLARKMSSSAHRRRISELSGLMATSISANLRFNFCCLPQIWRYSSGVSRVLCVFAERTRPASCDSSASIGFLPSESAFFFVFSSLICKRSKAICSPGRFLPAAAESRSIIDTPVWLQLHRHPSSHAHSLNPVTDHPFVGLAHRLHGHQQPLGGGHAQFLGRLGRAGVDHG